MMGDTGYADPYAPKPPQSAAGGGPVGPYAPPVAPPAAPSGSVQDKGQQDMTGTQAQGLLQQGQQQPQQQQQSPLQGKGGMPGQGGGGSVLQDVASLAPLIISLLA